MPIPEGTIPVFPTETIMLPVQETEHFSKYQVIITGAFTGIGAATAWTFRYSYTFSRCRYGNVV